MRTLLIESALHAWMQEHHAATSSHCVRVSHIAADIAARLGLSDEAVRVLARAARLHDIGKIDVPSHLLIKAGQLTADERALLDCHPDLGVARIACLIDDPTIIDVIGSHHERWDGSGYPRALTGTQIPLAARIVAVADVYDALREQRSYKPAWNHAKALSYIRSVSGTKFDPAVVEAFAAAVNGLSSTSDNIYV